MSMKYEDIMSLQVEFVLPKTSVSSSLYEKIVNTVCCLSFEVIWKLSMDHV